jgi:hypothetical protein
MCIAFTLYPLPFPLRSIKLATYLFDLFMCRVLVTVTTEFAQLQSGGGVPTIFHSCIAGNTRRAFSKIAAALGAFQCDDDTNALFGCHTLYRPNAGIKINTVYNYLTTIARSATSYRFATSL